MKPSSAALARWNSLLVRGSILWVCLGLLASVVFAEARQRLVLRDASGTAIFSAPVQNGSVFAIAYTHSVAQTPVTDYFLVRDGAIWLEGSVYHDFGAGLPHAPTGPGQQLRQEQGQLIMSGYNRCLGSFDLRVGRSANHELILFKGTGKNLTVARIVPLDSLVAGGDLVNFSIAP